MVVKIDEVKSIFLLGSSRKRCTHSRALARAATRRLAILEKGHAVACFGSRGYSPARSIYGMYYD